MTLQTERLEIVGHRLPEITAAICGERSLVLDGVVCVLDPDGGPDLAALVERLVTGAAGAHRLPAVYLATDILHLDGAPLMRWPLGRRLEVLRTVIGDGAHLQVPDVVVGHGVTLAAAAAERGLAALLARRLDAPYRPGVASPDRLLIDLLPRLDVLLRGISSHPDGMRLLLVERVDNLFVDVGEVPAPPSLVHRLMVAAGALPASADADAAPRWLEPPVVATVEHEGRDAEGHLVHPRLIALRPDRDPSWCRRRRPVPPPAGSDPLPWRAFSPTVLSPLPLDG